ncbi:MAG: DNA-processing protein DprA [Agathobacter sp.]
MELYYIWLECIKGLGPSSWHALFEEFGNAYEIYINRMLIVPKGRVTEQIVKMIKTGAEESLEKAKIILEDCKKQGIRIVKYGDPEFPENIRENPEFPILFYTKGNIKENWTHGSGIVGARRCSPEGKECAIKTAIHVVDNGCPVISGLAKGVDSYSHTAAINHGGYTIAVLGFGLDQCYPSEHRKLKDTIAERGLLISEYPPGTPPDKFRFPKRNRIIAGLSDILYVIDTGKKSGTKTTIQAAARYGKEICSL